MIYQFVMTKVEHNISFWCLSGKYENHLKRKFLLCCCQNFSTIHSVFCRSQSSIQLIKLHLWYFHFRSELRWIKNKGFSILKYNKHFSIFLVYIVVGVGSLKLNISDLSVHGFGLVALWRWTWANSWSRSWQCWKRRKKNFSFVKTFFTFVETFFTFVEKTFLHL
jgi:hypothetical protein